MKQQQVMVALAGAVLFAAAAACAPDRDASDTVAARDSAAGTLDRVDPQMPSGSVTQRLDGWHDASREAATMMVEKYGEPAEETATMLVWHNTGPWKRTVISKEAVQHNFPMPHPDVMEQIIDYQVPWDKFDELAQYDGSVIVERTKGEMSARCDKEAANFLAINLAHDIVVGKLTVDGARAEYARQIKAKMANQSAPYTEGIKFTLPTGATGFTDSPAPGM